MNSFNKFSLSQVVDNFDNIRVPLSAKQRERIEKIYPYYGAQSIIDYVDDYLFDGEYILVAEDGENLKSQNSNVCNLVKGKFWVNNHAHIIKGKDGNCTKYLYYYLNLIDYKPFITGSAQPKLTKDNLLSIPLSIHNKTVQKSIAKVLSDLDAKIELNNKINQKLEAMAKLLYDYWFVQFDFPNEQGKPYKTSGGKMVYNKELKREIPEGWEVKLLSSEIEIQRGISYTSKEINGVGIPMINLNSFNLDGTYKPDGVKSYSGKYTEKNVLKSGDLLIAATDVTRNADIIGRAILVPDYYSEDLVFSMDIAKIVSENIPSSFLMMLFNSIHYHNYIKWYATGTLVLHLNLDGVNRYKTEIPSNNLLKMFDKFYLPIANRIYMTNKQNQQLSELRDWLLPMLMNGQVTVKEAEEKLSMAAEPSVEYKKG